jgi:ribonuclease P protein component
VLAAAARLRRPDEFATTVRRGRRATRGALVVHVYTDPVSAGAASGPARAGFIVSRTIGGAVVRNAVRRRLRHAIRDRLALLPAGTGVVVRALPAAAARSYRDLDADLAAALTAALAVAARSGSAP